MPARIDITGQRFGRWVVIGTSHRDAKHSYWHCACDCGNVGVVVMNSLRRGLSQSCGCLMRERAAVANRTHGHTVGRDLPPEYGVWQTMKNRCYNPKVRCYPNYGGRGIVVCDEWRGDFAQFLADMGPRPKGLTIERKDNDGPYAKWNCIWADRDTQSQNKRNNLIVTLAGERMKLAAASTKSGIPLAVLYHRITRRWPAGRLFEPPRRSRRPARNP